VVATAQYSRIFGSKKKFNNLCPIILVLLRVKLVIIICEVTQETENYYELGISYVVIT
jgi:hypothetical protein